MRTIINKSKIVSGLKPLLSNESGNIAFISGIAIMPIMLVLGAAVDYANAVNTKVGLQSAVDAAALYAAALGTNSTNTELTNNSKPFFVSNYNANGGTGIVTYAAVGLTDSVKVTASVPVSNAFMLIAGYPTTTVSVASTVKKSGINLEVSLVLDNTGSMNSSYTVPGTSIQHVAITDLKSAAKNFVDAIMPATQGQFYTKIAAVPYNNGVNLGSLVTTARGTIASGTSTTPGSENYKFSTAIQDYSSVSNGQLYWNYNCDHDANGFCTKTLPITNCVTERTGTAAYTDASVLTYPVGRAYLGSNNSCSVQEMLPLSTNATALKNTIAAMTAGGSTAGQVGIAWGWYALSPNIGLWSNGSVPSGYDKLTTTDVMSKVKKVMILMTDAEYNSANYNGVITGSPTVSGSGSGFDHVGQPATNGSVYMQSNSVCSAIKASGVEVYVITFQLNNTIQARVDLTNNCATDAKHVINADTTSLDAAFSKIANEIQAMRIAE